MLFRDAWLTSLGSLAGRRRRWRPSSSRTESSTGKLGSGFAIFRFGTRPGSKVRAWRKSCRKISPRDFWQAQKGPSECRMCKAWAKLGEFQEPTRLKPTVLQPDKSPSPKKGIWHSSLPEKFEPSPAPKLWKLYPKLKRSIRTHQLWTWSLAWISTHFPIRGLPNAGRWPYKCQIIKPR